jgi:TATA-box binding protein (TBP) (component of TFIID and TFIIIB)
MCSVARLRKDHALAQAEHVQDAYRAYDALFDFSLKADLPPDQYRQQSETQRASRAFTVRPVEGWLSKGWNTFSNDPMATSHTYHDIVPREVLRDEDPTCTDHSGSVRLCREVAALARQRLDEYGLVDRARDASQPLYEHFTVRKDASNPGMFVQVVNLVHTSYCTVDDQHDARPRKIVFTTSWMWRRLVFTGCQRNHTYTSLKINFKPPFKSSELLFSIGRVLETGSASEDTSHVNFFDVTLEYFRRSGMPRLHVRKRASQNVVAKSCMPNGQGLLLDLLQTRMPDRVTYEPWFFAGAIIRHLDFKKIMMLAFSVGSIVCVGPTDIPAMRAAFDSLYDTLQNHTDTPENRAILAQYRNQPAAQTQTARKRGRKRHRDEFEDDHSH